MGSLVDHPLFANFIIQDGEFIFMSRTCERLLGIVDSFNQRINTTEVFDMIVDPVEKDCIQNIYRKRLKGQMPKNRYELHMRKPTGQDFWVDLTVENIVFEKKPAIHGIFADITEKKNDEIMLRNSQLKLLTILTSISDLIFLIDENGIFLDFPQPNIEHELLMDYRDFVGQSYHKILKPDIATHLDKVIKMVKATNKAQVFDYSMMINGVEQWYNAKVSPLQDDFNDSKSVIVICRNITEFKKRESVLIQQKKKIQLLSDRLTDIQESDRKFIARRLHDIVGQKICLAKIYLEKELTNYSQNRGEIERISLIINEVANDIRYIMSSLYSQTVMEHGMRASLYRYVEEYCRGDDLECTLNVSSELPKLSYNTAINIYRIFQEALHNIRKHAGATNVEISLYVKNRLLNLVIKDNGSGFNVNKTMEQTSDDHFGILNMRERALMLDGKLEINSDLGQGTIVSCSVPIVLEDTNG